MKAGSRHGGKKKKDFHFRNGKFHGYCKEKKLNEIWKVNVSSDMY